MSSRSSLVKALLPLGTLYCGRRWKEVRDLTSGPKAVMTWTPVDPFPITPTRLFLKS